MESETRQKPCKHFFSGGLANKVPAHGQGRGVGSRAGGTEQEEERTISSFQQAVILDQFSHLT